MKPLNFFISKCICRTCHKQVVYRYLWLTSNTRKQNISTAKILLTRMIYKKIFRQTFEQKFTRLQTHSSLVVTGGGALSMKQKNTSLGNSSNSSQVTSRFLVGSELWVVRSWFRHGRAVRKNHQWLGGLWAVRSWFSSRESSQEKSSPVRRVICARIWVIIWGLWQLWLVLCQASILRLVRKAEKAA